MSNLHGNAGGVSSAGTRPTRNRDHRDDREMDEDGGERVVLVSQRMLNIRQAMEYVEDEDGTVTRSGPYQGDPPSVSNTAGDGKWENLHQLDQMVYGSRQSAMEWERQAHGRYGRRNAMEEQLDINRDQMTTENAEEANIQDIARTMRDDHEIADIREAARNEIGNTQDTWTIEACFTCNSTQVCSCMPAEFHGPAGFQGFQGFVPYLRTTRISLRRGFQDEPIELQAGRERESRMPQEKVRRIETTDEPMEDARATIEVSESSGHRQGNGLGSTMYHV